MQMRSRKRKKSAAATTTTTTKPAIFVDNNPYPDHFRPDPDECRAVRDSLLDLHGFPQQFVKYRNQRLKLVDDLKEEKEESVLDGLVRTILSQNTTELNSERAFASLKAAFPSWELVLAAEAKCIADAIRCGGLAPTKSSCIKNLLTCLHQKQGKLCMEYLRKLSLEEIKSDLSQFKGIGPKTVSCVLMFQLQQDDFPVDTHVIQIAKTMGWVPSNADVKKTYLHLNQRIPDELKFDLNCLLYTHGKLCKKCSNTKVDRQKPELDTGDCPLLAYRRYCKEENSSGND